MLALLQFDATSIPVLERMLEQGRLPALAELRSRGRWSPLGRSTPLFVEAGSYVSLYSGREIGDHGIYSAFLWSSQQQRVRFMNEFPAPPATWDALSRAGRRSIVIDPYESWPAVHTDGLRLLNGWQYRYKLLLHISRPRGAQTALALRHGRAPAVEHLYGTQSASLLRSQRRRLLRAPGRAAAAVEQLIGTDSDLIWVTFSAAHFAGHYYWDPAAALEDECDAETRRELEGTLEDSYLAVDEALGRILRVLPGGADVIGFSPIGMGPETSRSDLLPEMLAAVLDPPPRRSAATSAASGGGDGGGGGEEGRGSLIWRLRASMPMSVRLALARPLPRAAVRRLASDFYLRGTDWSRTRAFALPGDHAGYVRLNLRGRERDGVVDPDDADGLMDEIAEGLLSFAEPDGAPVAERVDRVRGTIDGERAGGLPDLSVRWSKRPSTGLRRVSSPRFGEIRRRGVGTGRTGNHNTEGWAILAPGASDIRDLGRAPLINDIPATALGLFGAELDGTSGAPLLESR